MELINNKNECCGCGACFNICPKNAITMKADQNGFIYPVINQNQCISCGLCKKVCDFRRDHSKEINIQKAYSLVLKNKDELMSSTSGGAFTALSNIVLKNDGVVAGTILDKNFNAKFVLATTEEERNLMKGSKYVQCYSGTIYRDIKKELQSGKQVIFVGCPCQAAALKSYLGNNSEGLIIVDFLCHGVPNNIFFKEHISYLEKRFRTKIEYYYWRGKSYGWHPNYIEEFIDQNKKTRSSYAVQSYVHMFWNGLSLRTSCFDCKYRSYHRESDITIADFWGIEKLGKRNNHTGVSLVLINSDKGNKFFKCINERDANIEEFSFDKVQFRISDKPAKKPTNTDEFWKCYRESGYKSVVRKYTSQSVKAKLKFLIKKIYRKTILAINK